ncbi:hypothetical protein IGS67_06915 [Flavimobilis sp. GY10621]|uniref:Major facilitator superfamily (MFS) profile domain-containing protein n=1 Tax=Flavimobilis rhizosphaerae TaxID=2775421 RepID=A0ABR9DQG4_9MICO|nr:hypothetical protein [Flavimobilis rhizosphaerae]MBD9699223.1 hypothetical protein [Flavimobilis rhizosphaerae]
MTDTTRPGYDGPHGSIVARSVALGVLVGTLTGLLMGIAASWGTLEYAPLTAIFGTLAGVASGAVVGLVLTPVVRGLARARTGRPTPAELATVASLPVAIILALVMFFRGAEWPLFLLGLGALSLVIVVGVVVRLLPWAWAPLRGVEPATGPTVP